VTRARVGSVAAALAMACPFRLAAEEPDKRPAAAPIGFVRGEPDYGVFLYLSFEHSFLP